MLPVIAMASLGMVFAPATTSVRGTFAANVPVRPLFVGGRESRMRIGALSGK
jgi:hypothetical protein